MSVIVAAVIGALAPCLLFVLNLVATRHASRDRTEKHVETSASLSQITLLVNGRLDEALRRIELLEHALGIEAGDPPPPTR